MPMQSRLEGDARRVQGALHRAWKAAGADFFGRPSAVNGYDRTEEGIEITFDYGSPARLRTPQGSTHGLGQNRLDPAGFGQEQSIPLVREAIQRAGFDVEEVRSQRDN